MPGLPHPPHQGTALRNWGLISHLAHRHDIWLLSFASADEEITDELNGACQKIRIAPRPTRSALSRVLTLIGSKQPDLSRRLVSPDFDAQLRTWLKSTEFDVVQIEGLEMGPFADTVRTMAPHTSIVYDAHNAETLIQQRAFDIDARQLKRWPQAIYSRLQLPRLRRFERRVCSAAHEVLCVSPVDQTTLNTNAPGIQAVLVPNGIELADYVQTTIKSDLPDNAIVFTGKMDYRPNVDAVRWFGQNIFPQVRQLVGSARFFIVGKNPTPTVQNLGEQKGITVTGAVPDIRPYVAGASVFVVPVRMGGGTRFKILEALALQRAVVSTPTGAEGFRVQSGHELELAESEEDFCRTVVDLFSDGERRTQLGEAGRRFVAASYDWRIIIPAVEEVYARIRQ